MAMYIRGAITAAVMAALVGCGRDDTTMARPQTMQHGVAQRAPAAAVPSGTQFSVQLNDDLNSATTVAGQEFTARVLTPLRASDGRVLVDVGATLRGRVANVERGGERSAIRLDFQTIDTVNGPVDIQATIVDPSQHASVALDQPIAPALGYDAILYARPSTAVGIGGGPMAHGGAPGAPPSQHQFHQGAAPGQGTNAPPGDPASGTMPGHVASDDSVSHDGRNLQNPASNTSDPVSGQRAAVPGASPGASNSASAMGSGTSSSAPSAVGGGPSSGSSVGGSGLWSGPPGGITLQDVYLPDGAQLRLRLMYPLAAPQGR